MLRTNDPPVLRTNDPCYVRTTHPCYVRTTSNVTTDRARAPQVRHTSPSTLLKVLYLFQYYPHLLPPPSELSLGRVIRRLDWIETVVQSVGLTVELPLDDPRLLAGADVDREVSRIGITRHTPALRSRRAGSYFCLSALVGHCIPIGHPIRIPSLDPPLVVRCMTRFITVVLHHNLSQNKKDIDAFSQLLKNIETLYIYIYLDC